MAKMKLLFPNLCDLATVSGGSWLEGDLSLAALLDPVLGHVARSTDVDPESTQMVWALDRSRDIGAVVVLGHNLSTAATIVLDLAADAIFETIVYSNADAPADAFPPIFRTRDMGWTHANWFSGRPLAENIGSTTTAAILILPRVRNARYLRLRISDPTNGDGYVEIGRVMFGPIWETGRNPAPGATLTVADESRMSQSLGGTRFFDRRGKRRREDFAFTHLRQREEFSRLFDLVQAAGITEEIFVMPDVDDARNIQRRSFRGHLREPTPLQQAVARRMGATFRIEELI